MAMPAGMPCAQCDEMHPAAPPMRLCRRYGHWLATCDSVLKRAFCSLLSSGIKRVQCGLHQFGSPQHGFEPLLHRREPSGRRERHLIGTRGLQHFHRLPASRRPNVRAQSSCSCPPGAPQPPDPFDRHLRQAGFWRLTPFGLSIRFLLRRLLRALADIGAKRVEPRLLLVAMRGSGLAPAAGRCVGAARRPVTCGAGRGGAAKRVAARAPWPDVAAPRKRRNAGAGRAAPLPEEPQDAPWRVVPQVGPWRVAQQEAIAGGAQQGGPSRPVVRLPVRPVHPFLAARTS